ncbi:MAG TPA: hypothetical protein PKL70_08285 [Saprospiraceae bacterium]|nr:hypothetical protein [Saprospiraceae bacterium]
MSRISSFSAPHKGLRNLLSKFSFLAGKTNFEDPAQVADLKKLGFDLFRLLDEHARLENEFILATLAERVPHGADHDLRDHEYLEEEQDKVSHKLKRLNGKQDADAGHDFYLSFSKYHSRYLAHILQEETVTEKLLQENFSDEELLQLRGRIMKSIPFSDFLIWVKYIIPAQNESENIGMLKGFIASAPPEAFQKVSEVLRKELPEAEYASLIQKVTG